MKKGIYILTFIGMISCESNENSTSADSEKNVQPQHDSTEIIETEVIYPDDFPTIEPRDFTLDEFPKLWYKLTCENGENCVIYNYCEAETQQIEIIEENGENFLLAYFGQDTEKWKITKFTATEKIMELYLCVDGEMELVLPSNHNEVIKSKFCWNKDMEFCWFDNIFNNPEMFVDDEHKDSYPEENEECTGLWE